MAAMSATSSCDDRPHNGWAAPEIPQLRIGLGDDDIDGAGKHGQELGQELGLRLADILMADFRWRCGSVEARVQRDPACPPTASISTTKGSRPTLSTSDRSQIDTRHRLTAQVLEECFTPHQQACEHTIAHLLLQSSQLYALLRPRKSRWNTELLGAAENPLFENGDPPPPYDNKTSDLPPPYTLHYTPAQSPPSPEPRLGGIDPFARSAIILTQPMTAPKPDLSASAEFRQRGKKKKNPKKGEDSWGSGDERKKDGGTDEKNDGDDAGDGAAGGAGAGAGAGAGGGGDDGDGGAGNGGGDDEWNTGKKKKKGKKGKTAVEEDEEKKLEEERKMKEQEEEDEKKKEEEATAGAGLPAWPGGVDADPGDEWTGFAKAEKKGKKGKKGKGEEEERKKKEEEEKKRKEEEVAEASPTADPLSWADMDHLDTSGGWGGFTAMEKKGKKGKKGNEEAEEKKKTEEGAATTTNTFSWAEDHHADADPAWATINANEKKGKKAKKSKFEPIPDPASDPNTAGSATFDNIDLGDSPQIEMNFGRGGALNNAEPRMDFLGFGTDWNTSNILDGYGAEVPNTDITDTFNNAAMDQGSAWDFTDSKKKKKQTPLSGFGLGRFDNFETSEQQSKLDDTKDEGNGGWEGGFTSAGKTNKKNKKKSGIDDTAKEPTPIVTDAAVADSLNNAEDTLSPITTTSSKSNKKKGKKNSLDASISELPPVVQPPPSAEPPAEEELGSFTAGKNKKKEKKGAVPEADKQEEASFDIGGEPDMDFGSGWGFAKKGKKTGKKAEEEPVVPETLAAMVVPKPEPEIEQEKDSLWGFGGKKSKKSKKGAEEESNSFEPLPVPTAPEPAFDDGGGWDFGTAKKGGKKGKKIVPEESKEKDQKALLVDEYLEPDPPADIAWNAFATKNDKKKGKKDAVEEPPPAEDLYTVDIPETAPIVEETLPSYGRKKDKKNKKGLTEVKEDSTPVVDSMAAAAATNFVADTDWMDWGTTDKKKDKKGGKGIERNEGEEVSTPLPPPPAVPDIPEPNSFGWGSSKKEKKGKNAKPAVVEPPLIPIPDPVTNFLADENEGGWGRSWGFSARDKKKKEDEEQERKERELREEEERLKAEEEEAKQIAEKAKEKEKEKEKPKPGKKGKASATAAVSKTKDVAIESNADANINAEGDTWGAFSSSKAKDKKKGGRKDAVLDPPPPAPTPPAQGLTPEPTPEPFADPILNFDDYDNNNTWGSVAPSKAKGKKDGKKVGKIVETKAENKASKDEAGDTAFDFLQDNDQDGWGKSILEEETPAKTAKSFWSLGAGSTTKSKLSKEKEKEKAAAEARKAEEPAQDLIDLDGKLDDDALMDLIDEPAPKGFKSKAGSKLSNTATKESDKSSKIGDNKKKKGGWTEPWGAGAAAAVTTAAAGTAADTTAADDDRINADTPNSIGKSDGWNFWGAKKATATTTIPVGNSGQSGLSGKLADEPKKEITKYGLTNQIDSLTTNRFSSKEPEPSWLDDQAELPKSSKPAKSSMSSTKPVTKTSSVAARVKALEKEKEKGKIPEPAPSPPVKNLEPLADAQLPTKKSSATGKSKFTSANKNAPWEKKDLLSLSAEESKETADFLPGSFPDEGAEDDIVDVITVPLGKKSGSKNAKTKKAPIMDPVDLMDLEDVPEFQSSSRPGIFGKTRPPPPPPAPEAPPTPPPEPVASKPAKKERARVVRDEGASSWGFWGAAPKKPVKKEVKAKDDADLPSPFAKEKPGLTRSKTTKVGKEKDLEKSSGKSSGSDKDKKPEPRPSKSRGSSFGGLFGGPPPARAKPIRRTSVATPKNASRRQSMDIDALGLPSPPVEDAPEMSSKAAKLMGANSGKLGRKESIRGKPRTSVVPDPYPIDDDDMVLVNSLEDPIINAPIPKVRGTKDRSSKTKAGKEAKQTPDLADDVVMVEGGPSNDGSRSPVAKDDLAFTVERPKPLQRASTSARKPGNSKIMGLFGGFQKSRRMSEVHERTRSKPVADDDEVYSARKRTATGEDDGAKRIRRDDRRIRRSERPDVTINGLTMDSPIQDEGVRLDAGNSESKREDRRAKRASRAVSANEIKDPDVSEGQERRARRRETERSRDDGQEKVRSSRDQKIRKEEDPDAVRREERRAKRAAKEDYAPQDLGFDIPEKRSKHRERDLPEASARDPESSSRPHRSDRRRSRTGHPLSPSGEAERRAHRSRRTTGERSSHRKSAAPAADYFDPQNNPSPQVPQSELPPLTQENHEPYMHGANDHTSSWVKSQISEPAPPPPVEPSVLDPAPALGPVDDEAEQEARRAARRRERRKSKYAEEDEVAADRRRRRRSGREGVRSSEGSGDGERDRDRDRRGRGYSGAGAGAGAGVGPGMGFGGMGGNGVGKRGSWFKKIGLQI